MKKDLMITFGGVFTALFFFSAHIEASFSWLPVEGACYYLRSDTGGAHIGFLSLDRHDLEHLVIRREPDEFALWGFERRSEGSSTGYYVVNKKTSDTLFFEDPGVAVDVPAKISRRGTLSLWNDFFLTDGQPSLPYLSSQRANFYPICMATGEVGLSQVDSAGSRLRFTIEREKFLPDGLCKYRFGVDTAGVPEADGGYLGFLSVQSAVEGRYDSLIVDFSKDSPSRGDSSLWYFLLDAIVSDTAYFRIRNQATGGLLAFDRPRADTVACVRSSGELSLWQIPFFDDQGSSGRFVLRDTATDENFYLGLRGDRVMLLTDTMDYRCLSFFVEKNALMPDVPDSCIVGGDSVKVHRVKYLSGADSGRYLGVDVYGRKMLLDTVYAHLPDGQFVVYRFNKFSLMSRAGSVTTGLFVDGVYGHDSLLVVYDSQRRAIPGWYTNRVDTFEITPVTYGNIDVERLKTNLGYKYFSPGELLSSSYVFSYASADTLNGCVVGYDEVDSLVVLFSGGGDTVRFVAEEVSVPYAAGAPAIADIPELRRQAYGFRSAVDSTLYFSFRGADSVLSMDRAAFRSSFFLKEGAVPGAGYCFMGDAGSGAFVRKLLADSTRHIGAARVDTSVTHLFVPMRKDRSVAAKDPYVYLTELLYGRGLYEFSAHVAGEERFLTKNYYDYAVFGREGESMLRSGSFAPADFHLWVDTARGRGYDADRASFFLVGEVDTLRSSLASRIDVEGYFLHVMDSMSLPSHGDYVVEVDGGKYNRVNFVKARRCSANALLLDSPDPQAKDSVGFVGMGERAINEYRFYLQVVDEEAAPGECYIVTEPGYGGKPGVRGYLSYKKHHRESLYVGPRLDPSQESEGRMVSVTISRANRVSNDLPPSVSEEAGGRARVVADGTGRVTFFHAAGERVVIYDVVGRRVADRVIVSDRETLFVSARGILIVKIGERIVRKIVNY
jgi:hypothetical protein